MNDFVPLEPFYLFGLYTHLEKPPLEGAQPHPDGIRELQGVTE